ncbi:semialdehyde dehydrogenase [Candidatus Poribacteria bacterium]|nr:semialdehyde dehydrogenase [Candidatus Poribacteria bacterium]
MIKIAIFGAAGKMGTRISNNLAKHDEYELIYVEAGEVGRSRLQERGILPTEQDEAARKADVIVLAVPDVAIGAVAKSIISSLKSGTMIICLDPAAPHAGELPKRDDISYFVTHPCHPPLINDETDPELRKDFFGGTKAKQNIVCALMQGPEKDYKLGESIACNMFAPVMNSHRITVDQMVLLEPAMAETVVLTCMSVVRETMDEVIKRGVPPEAAKDFLMGHMNVTIGILFNYIDAVVSDGARLMMERAKKNIFKPDWKKVFEPENVMEQVQAIVKGID